MVSVVVVNGCDLALSAMKASIFQIIILATALAIQLVRGLNFILQKLPLLKELK